jgi:hypothetical protein
MVKNLRYEITSKPVSGSRYKLDAIVERKSGESPKRAELVPDAIPMQSGKFFDAAKRMAKRL